MPSSWITLALFIAVPLVVHLRGGRIVALALCATALFGVGVLVYLLTQSLPPAPLAWLLDLLAGGKGAIRVSNVTYHAIPNYRAALVPAALFASITVIFWVLQRWSAPIPDRTATPLFWLLYLSVLAGFAAPLWMSGFGMPRRYVDYEDAFNRYHLLNSLIETVVLIALAGLILTVIWSILQRMRAHAL